MSDAIYILLPPGRMVQGDIFTPNTKDFEGNVRETPQYFLALAIPKGPAFDVEWAKIQAKAAQDYPAGEFNDPAFKWKYIDGDNPAHATKTGFPGHHVLRLSSNWEPEVYDNAVPPQAVPNHSPQAANFKKGNWYQISIGVKGNGKRLGANAGMYLNLSQIQLVGFAEEIRSTPNAATTFAAPVQLPQGVSATPLAAAVAVGAPAPGGQPAPHPNPAPGAPQAAAAPAYAPPAQPAAQAPPAQPAPTQAAPSATQPPPGYVLGVDANGQPAYVPAAPAQATPAPAGGPPPPMPAASTPGAVAPAGGFLDANGQPVTPPVPGFDDIPF